MDINRRCSLVRSRHIGWSGEPPLQFVDELLQNFAESIDPLCSDWCDTEIGVTHPFGSDPITLVFGVGGKSVVAVDCSPQ